MRVSKILIGVICLSFINQEINTIPDSFKPAELTEETKTQEEPKPLQKTLFDHIKEHISKAHEALKRATRNLSTKFISKPTPNVEVTAKTPEQRAIAEKTEQTKAREALIEKYKENAELRAKHAEPIQIIAENIHLTVENIETEFNKIKNMTPQQEENFKANLIKLLNSDKEKVNDKLSEIRDSKTASPKLKQIIEDVKVKEVYALMDKHIARSNEEHFITIFPELSEANLNFLAENANSALVKKLATKTLEAKSITQEKIETEFSKINQPMTPQQEEDFKENLILLLKLNKEKVNSVLSKIRDSKTALPKLKKIIEDVKVKEVYALMDESIALHKRRYFQNIFPELSEANLKYLAENATSDSVKKVAKSILSEEINERFEIKYNDPKTMEGFPTDEIKFLNKENLETIIKQSRDPNLRTSAYNELQERKKVAKK